MQATDQRTMSNQEFISTHKTPFLSQEESLEADIQELDPSTHTTSISPEAVVVGHRFDPDTLQALEWSKVTSYFAGLCRTEWGEHYARQLPFTETRIEAERELEQVREAHQLLMSEGEELPLGRVKDLRMAFLRLQKGGSLDAPTFLDIAHFLETLASVRSFVQERKEWMPKLWERGELLDTCRGLRREIEATIDRKGAILDDASWELGTLRQHVRKCHEGIRKKMQEYLSPPTSRYLTDTYYTIREDRYVLPVNASEQSRVPGIVYGSSSTGRTVYVEPRDLVERNNALRIAENDVSIEEARILRKLSRLAAKSVPSMSANLELLRDLDLIAAKVRMCDDLEASVPTLCDVGTETGLELKKARHPLLLLKGIKVVANDLKLGPKGRTLLISGPNTGGKTVSLKTMGICALMARAALPIPADAGSTVPYFSEVFTDIGDRQSIEHDLSTFSAQIVKLRSILECANNSTLVLIDEIVVGTDPEQGHALATAILESLTDKEAFVAVTTHYPELKALPHDDERFANACVGFNLETLSPTYRVYLGAPGGSSALAIARRLGIAEELCQRAEALMTPESGRFERILSRLEQQYEELYAERERASKARRQIERERLSLRDKQDELDRSKDHAFSQEETEWRNSVREARRALREATRKLKETESPDWERVRKVEKELQQAETQARSSLEQAAKATSSPVNGNLRLGQKVFLRSLRTEGELIELPNAQGQVLVRVGTLRTRVSVDELQNPKSKKQLATKPKKKKKQSFQTVSNPAPRRRAEPNPDTEGQQTDDFGGVPTQRNQCDLRGMRVEEAIDAAEAFLDKAFQQEMDVIYLIHGHGTGVLRKAIRNFCQSSSYVLKSRPGQQSEGGNGVTAVLLV